MPTAPAPPRSPRRSASWSGPTRPIPSRRAPPEPMREYAVVLLAAALVTFLATPVVRVAAVRFRVMAAVRDRDVHVIPTPRGGGVAMYLGVAAGVLVASQLPSLQRSFEFNTQTVGVLVAGGLICLL